MPLSRNTPCPCGSGRKSKSCCGPVLDGVPASSPEALMRSRYSAYASSTVGHLIATTAPDSPHRSSDLAGWRADLTAWCAVARFDGLTVFGSGTDDDDHGWVTFFARITVDGQDRSFGERSRFVRIDGRWFYVDGTPVGADGT